MTTIFKTLADALKAGFSLPGAHDADVSGQSQYGYKFQSADGRTTVGVTLTDDRNALGKSPCIRQMYPPEVTE